MPAKTTPTVLNENSQIQPEAPVIDVFLVELDIALERGILPRRHLPKAGQPRGYIQAAEVFKGVLGVFAASWRAWPDQAHFSLEDVPKLRQFIDAEFPEVPADARDPRIGGNLEQDSITFIQVREGVFQGVWRSRPSFGICSRQKSRPFLPTRSAR